MGVSRQKNTSLEQNHHTNNEQREFHNDFELLPKKRARILETAAKECQRRVSGESSGPVGSPESAGRVRVSSRWSWEVSPESRGNHGKITKRSKTSEDPQARHERAPLGDIG